MQWINSVIFTHTKKLFECDWFEQLLMTDFAMFSQKSDIIFYEERFNLFTLYGRLAKSSELN